MTYDHGSTPIEHGMARSLHRIIDAWESLPGGQRHSSIDIERWLSDDMAPAINAARRALGRKKPIGEDA